MDPVARCIYNALLKEAETKGLPAAYMPLYANERAQTWLLMTGQSRTMCEAVSSHFQPTSVKDLKRNPEKLSVLYLARLHELHTWDTVKTKHQDHTFAEDFLSTYQPLIRPLIRPLATKKPLHPDVFLDITTYKVL